MNEKKLKELMNSILEQTKDIVETYKQHPDPVFFVKTKNRELQINILDNFKEDTKPFVARLLYERGKDLDVEAIIIQMRATTRKVTDKQVEEIKAGTLDKNTLPSMDIIHMSGETVTGVRVTARIPELDGWRLGEIEWFTEDARKDDGIFSYFFRNRPETSDLDYFY